MMMDLVNNQYKTTMQARQSLQSRTEEVNYYREFDQMLNDDEFCSQSNVLPGLQGHLTIAGVAQDKWLRDQKTIGWEMANDDKTMVGAMSEDYTVTTADKKELKGQWGISKISIHQSSSAVLLTKVHGLQIYRVPIVVNHHAYWDELSEDGKKLKRYYDIWGSNRLFIEMDPADPTKPIACYSPLSSRSLCLDMGRFFNPAANPKCVP